MNIRKAVAVLFATTVLASVVSTSASAQAFPSRPVTLVVPTPPGGTADIVGRLIGPKLSELWNQPVIVENRPGAGSLIGTQYAARAAPDGHILLVTFNELATVATLNKNARLDPIKDLTRVVKIGSLPVVILGRPTLPVKDMAGLLTMLRQSPDKYTYSSNGVGSILNLYAEMFKHEAKLKIRHIPYRGSVEASAGVLSSEVDLMVQFASGNVVNYVTSGRAQAYAVASPERLARLPNVPTTREVGLPGLQLQAWYGVFAPAGTPAALVYKINADVAKALEMPDVKERLAGVGMQVESGTPEAFDRFFIDEHRRWTKLITDIGIETN